MPIVRFAAFIVRSASLSRARAEDALTTTSYALLAQLALKPWSAYELAVQRKRYLRFFWPRAQRAIYSELKRLSAVGAARAERTMVGRRPRTVYSITPAGRRSLAAWLATPVAPVAIEFEALLRIFSARLGTKEQLLRTLEQVRADVADMTAFNDGIIAEYVEGRAPFQADVHVRTLVVDYFTQFLATTAAWVERTIAEVERWPDLGPPPRLAALERIKRERYRRETAPGSARASAAPRRSARRGSSPSSRSGSPRSPA